MAQDKHHWYDGWFYDKIIAPNQDKLFDQIKNIIEQGSSVLDIGCGTGRLAFKIADRCRSVSGIDLSASNIRRALLTLRRKPDPKISFKHIDLSEIKNSDTPFFDYAVFTYVIHEVDETERISLLIDAARLSQKIIIGDYSVPGPTGIAGWISETIEFIAGRAHYRNYKSYMKNGGIYYLADKAGLKIVAETINHISTNHIVVLVK
jgi:SAM-dependent methyltransferase